MELPHLHIDESADYLAIDRLNHIRIRAATLGLTSHLRDDPLHTVGVTYAFLIFLECRCLHGILASSTDQCDGLRWRRCANALRPDCCTARRSPLISGDYGRYNKTCRYGLLFDTITLCNEHKQRRFDALGNSSFGSHAMNVRAVWHAPCGGYCAHPWKPATHTMVLNHD